MALTQIFANQAQSTLAGAITPSSLTANLSPGTGALFPSPGANQYFTMIFNDAATGLIYEEVWVTNVTGDTITMIRGQEGSTALNWTAGDIAFNGWTAGSANNLVQASQAQSNAFVYAADTGGAANVYAIALTPSMQTGIDGAIVYFKPAHTNTGASTLTVNAGTSYSLLGSAHSSLQGGEVFANGFAAAEFNSTLGAYVLLYCTGGSQQVAAASASNQAVRFGQVSGVVGQSRNLNMNVGTASATATLTADEIVVETALGGLRYCLGSFNQSINLATTGAGGMDTGSAPTSGYVAIYAIYNPTGNTRALMAVNASSTAAPSIYGGSNMPAGYTASALVSVWPTTSGGLLGLANQTDRVIETQAITALNTTTQYSSYTSVSTGTSIPFNARTIFGTLAIGSAGTSGGTINIASTANGVGSVTFSQNTTSGGATPFLLSLQAARTFFINNVSAQGGATFSVSISSYAF